MSADNWAVCPRCLAKARAGAQAERDRVQALYGSVPVEEFDAARAALKDVELEDFRTLREDYEFSGAEVGEVEAHYSCGCSVCGLGTTFKHVERFWSADESGA